MRNHVTIIYLHLYHITHCTGFESTEMKQEKTSHSVNDMLATKNKNYLGACIHS